MGNDWGSSCHGYTDRGRVERGIERELYFTEPPDFPVPQCVRRDLIRQTSTTRIWLKPVVVKPTETVSGVFYLGDEGGISCGIQPANSDSAVVVSLTHLRVPAKLPFAAAVLAYQKHRVKKLKQQGAA
jgi:hypothetical protein